MNGKPRPRLEVRQGVLILHKMDLSNRRDTAACPIALAEIPVGHQFERSTSLDIRLLSDLEGTAANRVLAKLRAVKPRLALQHELARQHLEGHRGQRLQTALAQRQLQTQRV